MERIRSNENEPFPVGRVVRIKVSTTTKEVFYVSWMELAERDFKKKLRDDLTTLLDKFQSGQKINVDLRNKFRLLPSDILKIEKELQELNFEDEIEKIKYIQNFENKFLSL